MVKLELMAVSGDSGIELIHLWPPTSFHVCYVIEADEKPEKATCLSQLDTNMRTVKVQMAHNIESQNMLNLFVVEETVQRYIKMFGKKNNLPN